MAKKQKRTMADGASVAEHARRLKSRPGWDPSLIKARQAQDLQLKLNDLRLRDVEQTTAECEQCALQREASRDSTALCSNHLAQAMGVPPNE